jgi:hypothetical protein
MLTSHLPTRTYQAASYRALVEGLRERLRAAGGEALEVYEAAYDEQVLSPVNGFITARRRAHEEGQEGRVGVFELGGLQALGWQASGVF